MVFHTHFLFADRLPPASKVSANKESRRQSAKLLFCRIYGGASKPRKHWKASRASQWRAASVSRHHCRYCRLSPPRTHYLLLGESPQSSDFDAAVRERKKEKTYPLGAATTALTENISVLHTQTALHQPQPEPEVTGSKTVTRRGCICIRWTERRKTTSAARSARRLLKVR